MYQRKTCGVLAVCLGAVASLFLSADTSRAQSTESDAAAWQKALAGYLAASRSEHDHNFKAWTPVAEWDFNDGKIPADFKVFGGDWEVIDGKLCASGGKPDGNRVIKIADAKWPAMRIEFDASLQANPGAPADRICDVGIFLNAEQDTGRFDKGYGVLTGTYFNQATVIYRLYIPYARTEFSLIKPGQTHKIVLEVVKPHIRLFVDGRVVLEAWERSGKGPANHGDFIDMDPAKAIALHTYDTHMKVDNLKILVPGK